MTSNNKIVYSLKSHPKFVVGFIIIFYCVGIIGMTFPATFELFKKLIPLAILLSFLLLLFFHTDFSGKTIFAFAIIYLSGFIAELAGVKTGEIFGRYYYGNSLGIKIFSTPLLIGINWLLLVYISLSVTEQLKIKPMLQVISASAIMVIYDILVEQMAPPLGMWFWAENAPPLRNYVAWFFLALIFTSVLKIFRVNTKNKLAPVLLICQLLFFAILFLTFNFLR